MFTSFEVPEVEMTAINSTLMKTSRLIILFQLKSSLCPKPSDQQQQHNYNSTMNVRSGGMLIYGGSQGSMMAVQPIRTKVTFPIELIIFLKIL